MKSYGEMASLLTTCLKINLVNFNNTHRGCSLCNEGVSFASHQQQEMTTIHYIC